LVFDSLNVQWSKKCDIDYVFVGKIAKYTKVQLCGAKLPANFQLVSKKNEMVLKFHSDATVTKAGFRAVLVAA